MNITGGSGTDTVSFASGDDHMTSGTINLAGGGSDKIDFTGILASLSATTEGVIINASNSAVVRDTGETYTTSIAAMTAAEYDDGAATKDVSTTHFSAVFAGVEEFVGTSKGDVFIAGNTGSTFTGADGDDEITLGAGTDTVIFSAQASNGEDTISGFDAGADGDALNVASVATLVGATAFAAASSTGTKGSEGTKVIAVTDAAAANWSDVLTVVNAAVAYDGTTDDNTTSDVSIVAVDNGTDTRVYLLGEDAGATDGTIDATELLLVATLSSVDASDLHADNFVLA